MPRRDVVARARHRHGRRRPRAAGRVAEVGRARPAAHRPRRPRRRRHVARAGSSRSSAPTCSSARSSCKLMREGEIEPTVVPRNALDVLAQQIVAIAASAPSDEPVGVDDLYALVTRTHSYAELPRPLLENVLDMLDGRYPSAEFGELRAAHRLGPRRRHDPRAQGRAPARGHERRARSPTAACSRVDAARRPPRRRARRGDGLRGAPGPDVPARRVDVAHRGDRPRPRDRHAGAGRPGRGAVLEGRRRRAAEGARRGDRRVRRWAVDQAAETLERDYDLDALAARTSSTSCASSRTATRVVPSRPHDRRRALPRRDRRLAPVRAVARTAGACTPPGALALSRADPRRVRPRVRRDLVRRRDHRPPPRRRRAAGRRARHARARRGRGRGRRASSASSALFGARFRENAGRALLIPRAYPGRRTPLWQQRLKSQSLLEVAKRYADFPIILETYRECLRDVLDVPGLVELLRGLHRARAVAGRGRDADRVAVRLVAALRLRRDVHVRGRHAERRAARGRAVARPRPAARAARPGGAARADRPAARSSRSRPTSSTAPTARAPRRATRWHDVLRRLGDLTADEVARPRHRGRRRRRDARDARAPSGARCALRVGGEQRWIAADDAGLYRDALGAVPPGGLPEAFLEDVADALEKLVARYARTHGPFTTDELRDRYGVDPTRGAAGARARRRPRARRAAPRRQPSASGATPRSCAACAAPRSPCCARRSSPPTSARSRAFLPRWQGVDRHPAAGAGIDRLREVLVPLQGLALPAEVWERDVLPRRIGAYSPTWLDQLCASGEVVWVGAGALGAQLGPRRAVLPRRRRGDRRRPPRKARARRREPEHDLLRERLAAGAVLLHRPARRARARARGAAGGAVGPRLGGRGDQRRVGAAARAAPDARPRPAQRARDRRPRRPPVRRAARRGAQAQVQGRWSLTVDDLPRASPSPASAAARSPSCCSSATASSPASRCSPRASPAASRCSTTRSSQLETLGVCRRGYFVEGLGGAQFALPGAVERLRAAARGRGRRRRSCSPRPTRRSPTAPRCRGRSATASTRAAARRRRLRRARRRRAGPLRRARRRGLLTLVEADDPRLRPALEALAAFVTGDRAQALARARRRRAGRRLATGRPLLVELGFRAGPRKLTLSA